MDVEPKVRQPYQTPVLRPLGTLTELTQGIYKEGPQDNGGTPYCGHEGEEHGTGGSGIPV
jgi:hypothetical protein